MSDQLAGTTSAPAGAPTRGAPSLSRMIAGNAGSLAGTTAITSILGFAYWWVATRSFDQAAVGLASAAISGMTLVATLASLGLGTFVMGEAPRRGARTAPLVGVALLVSLVVGALGAALYLAITALTSIRLRALSGGVGEVALFELGVTSTAVGLVLDQALIGMLRGGLQLARNLAFGLLKLMALTLVVYVGGGSSSAIFGSWIAGGLLSLAGLLLVERSWRRAAPWRDTRREIPGLVREMYRTVMDHQALNLALKVPILTLPVLVVALVSASANASFYIAWMVANLAFVLPGALATVLYATTAAEPGHLGERMRSILWLSLALSAAATVVLVLGASLLMSVFGDDYSGDASTALRLLGLSGVPVAVKNYYIVVVRVRGLMRRSLPLVWGGATLELALAVVGGITSGLDGFCAGWLLATVAEALVMAPTVARTVWR